MRQAAEDRFVDGLLERRLFPLAVLACREHLDGDSLTQLARVNAVIDLSRTFAAWAKQYSPEMGLQHWRQAERVLEDWLKNNRENELALLISRQRAHVNLQRGEFARQISAGAINPEPNREKAVRFLQRAQRIAVNTLEKINDALLPRTNHQLSTNALLSLQTIVEQDLSQIWIAQARCFEPESPDRIHALQQAEKLIVPLAAKKDPIDWQSRVAQLACLQLLGGTKNQKLFDQKATIFLSENPPVDIKGRIHLELARQFSTRGNYLQALETLNQPMNYSPQMEAKIDFCELQIMLQAAESEGDSETANWSQQAENQLTVIENLHDPYWLQRARALFGRKMTINPSQHPYALLARAAEGLYQAGQRADAAKLYREAAEKAEAEKNSRQAFELYRAAALIDYEDKRYARASANLRQLAEKYPESPEAANTHLMAAYNLAQSLKGHPSEDFTSYTQMLEEHLIRWPTHATSNQARLWLGRVMTANEQWESASLILFEVDSSSAAYPEAIQVAGLCSLRECEALAKNNDASLPIRAQKLSEILAGATDRMINAGSRLAPIAVADTAALQMHYTSTPYNTVLDLIQRGLKSTSENNPKIRLRLQTLQVEALVGLGRYQEALDLVQTIQKGTQIVVDLILNLYAMESREDNIKPDKALHSLAEVELACLHKLEDLSAFNERKQLVLIQAESLSRVGKTAQALKLLRDLANEYSEEGQIQLRYADLLLKQKEMPKRSAALRKYREVARRTRPQSQQWFAAKYGEANARLLLGDAQTAAQTIRTIQVLYPNLGGERWRQLFESLLAKCIAKAPKLDPASE